MAKLIVPDCLFPSDNAAEIPLLRADMQATACNIPFCCYGENKRTAIINGGTIHFYTDDYRYETVYEHPEKILTAQPSNIIEPNFSLYRETPIAFGLQQIYKKRWVARYLQDNGIRIFVDLNVAPKFYKLNLQGVPHGWRAFATRGYSDRLQFLEFEYNLACEWADGEPLFVIYSGGEKCNHFAKTHPGCVYLSPQVRDYERNKKNAQKAIADSVSLFPSELLEPLKIESSSATK